MMRHIFTNQQDNIICTFVKLYKFNVSYGLKRASEYLGIRKGVIVNRYYNHLRNSREIFYSEFGNRVIWNTRSINKDELDDLRKFEPKIVKKRIETFESLDKRNWWKIDKL